MDSLSFFGFLFVIFLSFLCSSQGYKFYVGGKEGWVLNPSESYSHWVGRNRFQVNDTIVFKYKKDSDSVLVVHKDDYFKCNKTKPIHNLKDGHSKLKFTRSGPFYFISGQDDHCEKGQKVLVVVISPNHHHMSHKSPVAPSPESVSPVPAPAKSSARDVSSSVLVWVFSLIMAVVFL
ncbi:early nodulin-like protein 3 [Lycium ferocissimum]|uniref:early nodulin-like protein 3 n=1 Tax=Lycium ferocissimum TaxID=112874 RepID=UPI002815311E|nr:early nodulin-like protein 3 [Lycium ferocissimum]